MIVPTQLNRLSPLGNAETPLSPPHIILVSSCCNLLVTAVASITGLLSVGPALEGCMSRAAVEFIAVLEDLRLSVDAQARKNTIKYGRALYNFEIYKMQALRKCDPKGSWEGR